ncbi:hypothetical protein ANCCAN_02133 [Ancylostoma caninum]|uniref:Uncharacterized protein n=1 Tax=Ancylostoma caninum TaxID=29170 RepID=A0A368H587_ANCCA|nr:hypothetical protein ANCCAN_02133 [Ancylostoma caninum]
MEDLRESEEISKVRYDILKHAILMSYRTSYHRCYELITYGLVLNIIGAGLLILKAHFDKNVIEATIQKKFDEYGFKSNDTSGEEESIFEPNSYLIVLITMLGRIANVVGTMKMYKGLGKFFSERKRKKFRRATERVQNGDTEVEITELFADCCQFF